MNRIHGGNIWKVSKETGTPVKDIIDFSSSVNPLGISKRAVSKLKEIYGLLSVYPEQHDYSAREELSKFHALPAENILTGNGSTELIYIIPHIFKPKSALIIEPTFSEYKNSLKICGCIADEFIVSKETNFFPDIPKLFALLKNKYDILYICNPANPAGTLLTKDIILRVAQECRRYDTLLIVDEAFIDFIEDESVKNEAVEYNNLIVLRSMTKFFAMAGLRFGYLVSSEEIVKKIASFQPPWSVNTVASLIAVESLRDKEYISETRRWFETEHRFLFCGISVISDLKLYPSNANYFLVEVSADGITSGIIYSLLLGQGIIIRDCSSFGLGDKIFRIAVKNRDHNSILIEKLNEIFFTINKFNRLADEDNDLSGCKSLASPI